MKVIEEITEVKPRSKNRFRERHDIEVQEEVTENPKAKEKEKEESPRNSEDKPAPKKKKAKRGSLSARLEPIREFIRNEKTRRVFALFLLLATVYMTVAFTSFFFTWTADQDKVTGSWVQLMMSEESVENWLGKTGAIISHVFIHRGFGIASMLFPFFLLIAGVKLLFGIELLPAGRTFRRSLFALVFLSIALGYVFHDKWFYLGGTFGYQVSEWLNRTLGAIGTGSLLCFSLLTFLVISFNLSFAFLRRPEAAAAAENGNVLREDGPDVQVSKGEDELIIESRQEEPLQETGEEKELPLPENLEQETSEEKEEIKPLHEISVGEGNLTLTVEQNEFTDQVDEDYEKKAEELVAQFGEYDPTLDLGEYKFPTLDLLAAHEHNAEAVGEEELNANAKRIVQTLKDYNIEIEKIKATIGPTVTLYEIVPKAGVRISRIKSLENDIALSLAALGIRIIAPIPGQGTIGIEVPNMHPEIVPSRSVLGSEKFVNSSMELPLALGRTISNQTYIADLTRMPHLLIAGATGMGKSVGVNMILSSLLFKKHPSQLKLVLIDPKKVELALYNKIERHFLAKLPDAEKPIITDSKKVVNTLNSLVIEMENRYELLEQVSLRTIKEYNAQFVKRKLNPNNGHRYLPYIVVVIDEFADFIIEAGKEVEVPIARLAQKARAVGIHLIVATQRPSVDVITGTIKANFPARIAFRVSSKIDSRTILDTGGADQLVGKGDMLYSTGSDMIRLQCAFIDTPEVTRVAEFIGAQKAYPSAFLLPEYVGEEEGGGGGAIDPSERDPMFDEAARIVVTHQQGSASLLQRKLQLGYNRAGRIIDQLEAAGIIGPFKGSKAREVIIKDILTLEQFLKKDTENP